MSREDGTNESVVGYDRAYCKVFIPRAQREDVESGDIVNVEVTDHTIVYVIGELV